MDKVNLEVRKFGTSLLQYNPLFKNRDYVRRRLKVEKVKVEAVTLPRFMFHPENGWYVAWTLVGFFLIIYAVSFMPYGMLFYGDHKTINAFEDWMNVYFMLDIFVNFNVAIDDAQNPGQYARLTRLLVDRCKISKNYMSGFFFLDLLSSIPFNLFTDGIGTPS